MAVPARHALLRRATRGCSAVVLAATPTEAEPVERALVDRRTYEAVTKTLVVGKLASWPELADWGSPLRLVLVVTGCDKTNVGHALTLVLEAMETLPALVVQVGVAGAFSSRGCAPHPAIGDIVIASSETYADTGSSSPEGWVSAEELGLPVACVKGVELGGRFQLDPGLVEAVVRLLRRASAQAAAEPGGSREVEPLGSGEVAPTGPGGEVSPGSLGPRIWSGPCLTSSRVTGTREEAEEITQRFQALAESMEGAAAAHICALYRVPFLEIRGISNFVGDRDRSTWQVERAAATAAWAGLTVLSRFKELPLDHGGALSTRAP